PLTPADCSGSGNGAAPGLRTSPGLVIASHLLATCYRRAARLRDDTVERGCRSESNAARATGPLVFEIQESGNELKGGSRGTVRRCVRYLRRARTGRHSMRRNKLFSEREENPALLLHGLKCGQYRSGPAVALNGQAHELKS